MPDRLFCYVFCNEPFFSRIIYKEHNKINNIKCVHKQKSITVTEHYYTMSVVISYDQEDNLLVIFVDGRTVNLLTQPTLKAVDRPGYKTISFRAKKR